MPVSQEFMDYVLRVEPIKSSKNVVDSLQRCLRTALRCGQVRRVKDYLLAARMLWHNYEECPLDRELLQDAVRFLRNHGWVVNLYFDDPDRMFLDPQKTTAVILESGERWTQ